MCPNIFQFSDMLVYTSRTSASLLQFKVHGQLPLRGMTVSDSSPSFVSCKSLVKFEANHYCVPSLGRGDRPEQVCGAKQFCYICREQIHSCGSKVSSTILLSLIYLLVPYA